ncbi:hypothetical protein ABZ504_24405 [Streptomyces mirabilis]|uniref:hypothetical protein n=1 Tax=Streptomyces mirabilis TaxID=68239 RepID=UPI0033E67F2F
MRFAQFPSCAQALYDTSLLLRRVNDETEQILGLTEDDMRGLHLDEIWDSPCRRRVNLDPVWTGEI